MQASLDGHPFRVLIADDSAISRSLLINLVESLGGSAFVARNGRQAVDACRNDSFDLILMDCRMPGLDGYAATRLIRSMSPRTTNGKPLPVIGVTASYNHVTRQRCLNAGMNECLPKPLRRTDLAELLDRAFISGYSSINHKRSGVVSSISASPPASAT